MDGFMYIAGGNFYYNEDKDIEVWPYRDGDAELWGFTSEVIGFKVERDGYQTADLAAEDSLRLVPERSTANVLVMEQFDSMSDRERLEVVQELNFEHGNCFEWSDVMPIGDFLEGLSRDELISVAVYGDLSNTIDPVRYDKYGHAEQVSYQQLYSEICENEGEILDVLIDVLDQGSNIYCTDCFDQLGDAISDGTWRDWIDDDKICKRQEVRVCSEG